MTSERGGGKRWPRMSDSVYHLSCQDWEDASGVYKPRVFVKVHRVTIFKSLARRLEPHSQTQKHKGQVMNRILAALLVAAAVTCCAHAFCYDAQVAKDQAFDDSFVCQDDFPYPADLIASDLQNADLETRYFLDTATSCFNETGYFTNSKQVPGEYAYQCVCPTPRKRVDRVYVNNEVCFVVHPEKQDIQYAKCGGHCSFDYGTQIATAQRGYYCVHQGFTSRQFLVWCPSTPVGTRRVARAAPRPASYKAYGRFQRLTKVLPTLCSCRGYFCENHVA